jgi:hypothetical protein
MLARVLLLTVTALVLAGCSGSDDDTSATSTAATPTTTTGTTPTTPGLEGASTETVSRQGDATETALLTAVRAASHDGYDRVVFEFRNAVPGYEVGYVERPVLADGSGEPVEVDGGAVLLVRMEPALDADLTQESAPRTYAGPSRFSPETAVVAELVRTGGFEAVLTWAVGTDEERPFLVTRLESPARIVVDVARPESGG